MSDSNDFTVIGLSKVNSSIVGPDVFPSKSFYFVISQVKQLFIFFGKVSVEFVLAPQHGTSCDPKTTTKEDFDYLKKIN